MVPAFLHPVCPHLSFNFSPDDVVTRWLPSAAFTIMPSPREIAQRRRRSWERNIRRADTSRHQEQATFRSSVFIHFVERSSFLAHVGSPVISLSSQQIGQRRRRIRERLGRSHSPRTTSHVRFIFPIHVQPNHIIRYVCSGNTLPLQLILSQLP